MSGKRKHNTRGPVVGEAAPAQKPAAEANPKTKPETADERGRLQRIKDGIDEGIDQYVEASGSSTTSMVLGAAAKAVNEVFMPTAIYEIIPVGKVFKFGKKATDAVGITKKGEKAADAGKAQGKAGNKADAGGGQGRGKDGGGGGRIKGKKKRKPSRRCELVPYDELECEPGQEAHHVVPDWMLRLGKRGGPARIPDMPSLAKGPAICLEGGSGKEHNTAHKHTDRPAQRVAKGGRATGTAGTITLGQGKAISSRAIEKATGGKKGGGCDRKDIQKQLDEQFKAHNDTVLRGVKDARKVTEAIKNATKRTIGDI